MPSASSHSRTSSANSAFSLASPLAFAPAANRPHARGFLAKLKAVGSKKKADDDEMDWMCKGEDLENNFAWPDTVRSLPLLLFLKLNFASAE